MLQQLVAEGVRGLGTSSGTLISAAAAGLSRAADPAPPAPPVTISGSACSPPRTVSRVTSGTTVTAPSRTVVASKRKRRKLSGSSGDSGGDDDGPGDGGNWGEGWGSDGDDEGGPWKIENLWAWQVICIGSLLQAAQYLMMQQSQTSDNQSGQAIKFAAISSGAQ